MLVSLWKAKAYLIAEV